MTSEVSEQFELIHGTVYRCRPCGKLIAVSPHNALEDHQCLDLEEQRAAIQRTADCRHPDATWYTSSGVVWAVCYDCNAHLADTLKPEGAEVTDLDEFPE